MQKTRIAGVGVLIPIAKDKKFVNDVIVIEGPALASISATRSLSGKSELERFQEWRNI